MALDLTCGMEVDPDDPPAVATYDGVTYYFCSEGCRQRFEQDPERYVAERFPFLGEFEGMRTPHLPFGETRGEFDLDVEDRDSLGVGDAVTLTRDVTAEDVETFARVTSDTNALHLNDEFASNTRFGRRIAHGTLVAGFISAALAAFPGMTIYLTQDLEFVAPADIGETYVAECAIVDELAEGRYRLATHVRTTEGEDVVQGTAVILIDQLPTDG
jgi:acyl dehydratase/YHS domain-containing protein